MEYVNIFAYGELMKENVTLELIGGIPEKNSGKIYNFEKFFDEKIGYWGVRIKENSYVNGIILFNITSDELEIFDNYEDEGTYYSKNKTICRDLNGNNYESYVYVRLE
ncbi:gamma-glutamylcyclotransferase family protein [Methanococcus maripaludis]|nr:gamma-glutamylcyclotransferase family protein [Methanococcus maripaludis]